jgi:hypothetical protein
MTANLRRLDLLPNTRALTLIQPWAYAITNCGKDIENRSWPAPTGPGQRMHWASTLLIHAGKTVDLDDAHSTFTRLGCLLPPAPVTSAIVAVCRIVEAQMHPVAADELLDSILAEPGGVSDR